MIMLSLLSLIIAIGCRAVAELALHGKLRWSGKHTSFWGNNSWMRKYNFKGDMYNDLPPDNWYYRTFNIDYKERFTLSATFLVFLTDGMHLIQFFYHIFLSLSLALLTEIRYWPFYWLLIVFPHALFYWIFQRRV